VSRIETADDSQRHTLDLELIVFDKRLPRRRIDARVMGALEILRHSPADRNLGPAQMQGVPRAKAHASVQGGDGISRSLRA
jgi:hypothetical protein